MAGTSDVGVAPFDTGHTDVIHDAQVDYYGKRLATASSDRTVRIFDVSDAASPPRQIGEVRGHDGPVWQVAWAHPRFGSLLATCGFDSRVCVWKETSQQQWVLAYQYKDHESSVNSVAFGPHEAGLSLACGSADGSVSVLTWNGPGDGEWRKEREGQLMHAHQIGVSAVSWAPALSPGELLQGRDPSQTQSKFVSAGCDGRVKVWTRGQGWQSEELLRENGAPAHSDWVRDVCWAPNAGLPVSLVASCGQDKTVVVWSQAVDDQGNPQPWQSKVIGGFHGPVWRVSWSVSGYVLAVTAGDGEVSLWKQGADSEWRCVDQVGEAQGEQQ
jgi:protein transport protein SEC13